MDVGGGGSGGHTHFNVASRGGGAFNFGLPAGGGGIHVEIVNQQNPAWPQD